MSSFYTFCGLSDILLQVNGKIAAGLSRVFCCGHCLIKFVNRNDQSWIPKSEFLYSGFLVDGCIKVCFFHLLSLSVKLGIC
ncbi:hypothetical protein VNO77_32505 [Canavalia gladiata]|uniref:Uncharacterized protein n=1 Tax=Canavalia gladiata TaxID=3824 RepID=A0AAN9KRW1_CANGL